MEISGKSYHINLDLSSIIPRFIRKVAGVGTRFIDYLKWLPSRLFRLGKHIIFGFRGIYLMVIKPSHLSVFLTRSKNWLLEFFILFLECFGIGEIYESLLDFSKFNTRSLYDWEIEMAKFVFGDAINYRRVRIDEMAFLGPRQKKFCYVSFYIINSWGPMQNSLLIHELIHVWQYEQIGAVYMPRAIRAQFSPSGYNYGGVRNLRSFINSGKGILDFNLEQQGDIVSDYYRIKAGYQPRWGQGSRKDLEVYEYFISQIRSTKS